MNFLTRKTIFAAAVPLLACTAQAQVQVYGKLYPYVLNERGSGATTAGTPVSSLTSSKTVTGANAMASISGMNAGNSRLGFKGSEDLGDGLKAIFQLETQVAVDSGVAGSGTQFWSRDTFVGLRGSAGTIRLGVMDTVLKEYGDTIGILGISSGTFFSSSSVLRKTGYGTSSASSFHLRRINSLKYDSPEFAGFGAALQFSTDEAKTSTRDPRVISLGIKYENGPLYASIAHEVHYDLFGGSRNAPASNAANLAVNSRDRATQAAVTYTIGDHTLGFDVIKKDYKENPVAAGAFQSYSNTAYMFSMESRWGLWRTAGHIVRSNAGSCRLVGVACSTDGLSGTKLTLGAGYNFSKRTYLFGGVSRVMNGKSARFTTAELGEAPNPGEDITQVAIGLSHSF